ncbi:hypothetical protein BGZ60DRAFT_567892 [Tricladium varicosporioides]|nr:hypothetical protein BGZ60DRAFT_567892 [Hymenoscyphus varicosporioides]
MEDGEVRHQDQVGDSLNSYFRPARRLPHEFKFTQFRKFGGPSDDEEEDDDTWISIGIDLGTTFSGVAWALSTSPNDINIISEWESDLPNNSTLHKVPSVLTYNSKGEVTSWGYDLDNKREFVSWFKLGLSDEAAEKFQNEQPQRFAKLENILAWLKKEPVDVVSDYLRCLWTHTIEIIQRSIGKQLWENINIKIVLTVPAIWDHKAQELTRRAADMAGLLARSDTTLELIGEPESAALAVFEEMGHLKKRGLKVGDSFVVCDAGGGTVDLISYTIEQLKPLKLAMCTESTGGLCGAVFLDIAFERQVRTMITAEVYAELTKEPQRRMMNEWEHGIKRAFKIDAPEDQKWHVYIPGYTAPSPLLESHEHGFPAGLSSPRTLLDRRQNSPFLSSESLRMSRVDPNTLVLKTGHLNAIFSGVSSKIKDLVGTQLSVIKDQTRKDAMAIFLVGGFGENRYLRQELERSFEEVEIQQPTKSWAAICRGAVFKGLGKDLVINHISKYHYGCRYRRPFVDGSDLVEDRIYQEDEDMWFARNQVKWFMHKGENVEKSEPIQKHFTFPLKSRKGMDELELIFYYSGSLVAESRVEQGSSFTALDKIHADNHILGVKQLCTFTTSFNPQLYDKLPVRVNNKGAEYRRMDIIVEMRVSSGELCWSCKHNGVEAGSVKMVVGYDGVPFN